MTPSILYISPFWPHKATSAGELRSLQIARALRDVGRVQIVVVGADGNLRSRAPIEQSEFDIAYSVSIKPRPNTHVAQKLDWALNARSACPHGMATDERDLQRVLRTAKQFDVLWFSELRTANAFPCWTWQSSVVDVGDIPSMFEQSTLNGRHAVRQRLSTSIRLWSWKRREQLLGERFNVITVCSENDKQYLRGLGLETPIHVCPNGFERPADMPVRRLAAPPRLGFIGVLDHGPNLAGITWFTRDCWPRIKRAVPDARLRLIGRLSDGPLRPEGVDIDGLGWVEDPADEIATWSATIVPVHVGAGTRGKIAHAFSQKCPVVSTSLGAYGYDPTNGRDMLLAESAEDFADACIRTIRYPEFAAAMAERAWHQFLAKWTWDSIRPNVRAAAEDCLQSTIVHRATATVAQRSG